MKDEEEYSCDEVANKGLKSKVSSHGSVLTAFNLTDKQFGGKLDRTTEAVIVRPDRGLNLERHANDLMAPPGEPVEPAFRS